MKKVTKKELRKTALKLLPAIYDSAIRTGDEDGLFQHEDWRTGLCLDAFLLAESFEDAAAYRNAEPEPQLKQLDQSVFDGLDEKWRFLAIDFDGETNFFESTPKVSKANGRWYNPLGSIKLCSSKHDPTNWQDSLIERESVELIGSDLCRAMLARGDKFVLCAVSDSCQEDTLLDGYSAAISSITDNGGFYGYDFTWLYATPINNQGEPLTAAEVGL